MSPRKVTAIDQGSNSIDLLNLLKQIKSNRNKTSLSFNSA